MVKKKDDIDMLSHIHGGKYTYLMNWLTTQEVTHTVTLLLMFLGAFALKFESPFWRWAYLFTSGFISFIYLILRIYQIVRFRLFERNR